MQKAEQPAQYLEFRRHVTRHTRDASEDIYALTNSGRHMETVQRGTVSPEADAPPRRASRANRNKHTIIDEEDEEADEDEDAEAEADTEDVINETTLKDSMEAVESEMPQGGPEGDTLPMNDGDHEMVDEERTATPNPPTMLQLLVCSEADHPRRHPRRTMQKMQRSTMTHSFVDPAVNNHLGAHNAIPNWTATSNRRKRPRMTRRRTRPRNQKHLPASQVDLAKKLKTVLPAAVLACEKGLLAPVLLQKKQMKLPKNWRTSTGADVSVVVPSKRLSTKNRVATEKMLIIVSFDPNYFIPTKTPIMR
jgi:hypothetical protein